MASEPNDWTDNAPKHRRKRTRRERAERSMRRNLRFAAELRAMHDSNRWGTWLLPLSEQYAARAERQAQRLNLPRPTSEGQKP